MMSSGRRERDGAEREGARGSGAGKARAAAAGGNSTRTARAGASPDPDVAAADRYGRVLAALFAAVGILLLALAATGRGWSFLLGAIDFLVIAAVLAWALRDSRRRDPGPPPPSV
jgi:hypothetical protein